jgi:hypothetical protein
VLQGRAARRVGAAPSSPVSQAPLSGWYRQRCTEMQQRVADAEREPDVIEELDMEF